jgi:hypothetical protein
MTRTIKFRTDQAKDWIVTKQFKDQLHLSNWIGYICRTKNYLLDEVFEEESKNDEI